MLAIIGPALFITARHIRSTPHLQNPTDAWCIMIKKKHAVLILLNGLILSTVLFLWIDGTQKQEKHTTNRSPQQTVTTTGVASQQVTPTLSVPVSDLPNITADIDVEIDREINPRFGLSQPAGVPPTTRYCPTP